MSLVLHIPDKGRAICDYKQPGLANKTSLFVKKFHILCKVGHFMTGLGNAHSYDFTNLAHPLSTLPPTMKKNSPTFFRMPLKEQRPHLAHPVHSVGLVTGVSTDPGSAVVHAYALTDAGQQELALSKKGCS